MRSRKSSRGQVLILIAFAIMGLVGITGLAVDGGLTFSDRRHAQNAADTAALAGAMAKIYAEEHATQPELDTVSEQEAYWKVAAWDMAEDNGYYDDIVNSEVYVWSCADLVNSSCGYYAGNANYVQVIITSYIDTFFARVLGITRMTNQVQAIALADDDDSGPLYSGDNIIALSTACEDPANFIVQGTADVTVEGGGLYVNASDPSCSFKCDTNSGTITGDVTTVAGEGAFDMSANCSSNMNGEQTTGGEQWDFPVYLDDVGLEVPDECIGPIGTYRNVLPGGPSYDPDGEGTDYALIAPPYTVLTPGSYWNFPPEKNQESGTLQDTIIMEPGIYCVNDVVKLVDTKLTLLGADVTLFIRDGYSFNMNGGTIRMDAPDEGPYAGYLIVLEPDYTGYPDAWTAENCTLTGNSTNYYAGAIFAPTCNLTINGADQNDTSEAVIGFESQVIAYTVKINGNKDINFSYNGDENPSIIDPSKTGLIK